MVVVASVLILAAAAVGCWSRADIGTAGRRAAVERFARRSGLPPSSVDDAAAWRVVRRDRVAPAGVILALPAGQHLLDQGLVFSSIAVGYVGLAVAALLGHLIWRPAPDGPRVAHATSRTVTAYVPPWLVGVAVAGAVMTQALLAAWALTPRIDAPIFPAGGGGGPTAALGVAVLGALAVSLWAARVVAGGRQVADSPEHLAVDDALRAQAVRDVLHLTAAISVAVAFVLSLALAEPDIDGPLRRVAGWTPIVLLLGLIVVGTVHEATGGPRHWRRRLAPAPA